MPDSVRRRGAAGLSVGGDVAAPAPAGVGLGGEEERSSKNHSVGRTVMIVIVTLVLFHAVVYFVWEPLFAASPRPDPLQGLQVCPPGADCNVVGTARNLLFKSDD